MPTKEHRNVLNPFGLGPSVHPVVIDDGLSDVEITLVRELVWGGVAMVEHAVEIVTTPLKAFKIKDEVRISFDER